MFTSRPVIAYALPPKPPDTKGPRRAPEPARRDSTRCHQNRSSASKPPPRCVRACRASSIPRTPSPLAEVDRNKAAEAADGLWQEIVQRVNGGRDLMVRNLSPATQRFLL